MKQRIIGGLKAIMMGLIVGLIIGFYGKMGRGLPGIGTLSQPKITIATALVCVVAGLMMSSFSRAVLLLISGVITCLYIIPHLLG